MAKKRTLMQEYRHQRKLLEKRVESAREAGFYFERNPIPEAVKRPTQASINRLKRLTSYELRSNAKYIVPETGEVVSGKRGIYLRQKEAGEKAYETRKKREEEEERRRKPPEEPEEPKPSEPPAEEPPTEEPPEEPWEIPDYTAEELIFNVMIAELEDLHRMTPNGKGYERLKDLLQEKWNDSSTDRKAFAEALSNVRNEYGEQYAERTYYIQGALTFYNRVLSVLKMKMPEDVKQSFEEDEDWVSMPF